MTSTTAPIGIVFPNGFALQDGSLLNVNFKLLLPAQRFVTGAAPVIITTDDMIITMNFSVATAIQLPKSPSRGGKPLRFIDAGNQCGANPVTLNCAAGDVVTNLGNAVSIILNANGQDITLNPYNDGTNQGWFL